MLGVPVFNGSAEEAVSEMLTTHGLLIVAPSPALLKLRDDQKYREAMQRADLVLADSGLLILLWRLATGRRLARVSGLTYLKALLKRAATSESQRWFWVVDSPAAADRAADFLRRQSVVPGRDHIHVASGSGEDHTLLLRIEELRPQEVIIAIRGGQQEKLSLYLREYLLYRPGIHCVGAALGFLTGGERPIPEWAERHAFGWLFRLLSQPGMLFPRIGLALALARMVFRYRSELPPLRPRWADV